MEGNTRSIDEITRSFLDSVGLQDFYFTQLIAASSHSNFAYGHITPEQEVEPLAFPPFAAGALCTPKALATVCPAPLQ